MRQGNNPKRGRGRGNSRNRGSNPRNNSFDSNGPSGRIRGNAVQVFEKYQALARDAQSAGDRITAENLFQHAEHYYRIMTAAEDSQNRNTGNGNGRRQARNDDVEFEEDDENRQNEDYDDDDDRSGDDQPNV
ncbi:MAG: DUF4167 domain-containing protein [Rhodospirillaceae bacterium]|jgi:hypothetical protein|nr:DUF4167 domain-containing protein [Rhodospirillaceae bacterium]MBT6119533.1 DUF4167 domain-containing protein [Rhodospirillaceae bacterium]